jgi:hypothetical protein
MYNKTEKADNDCIQGKFTVLILKKIRKYVHGSK